MTRRRCSSSSVGSVRLIIQRAVEDEFDTWLGRARYERRPEAPPGKRNGFRPRHLQTAEGELRIEIPQVREAMRSRSSRSCSRSGTASGCCELIRSRR